MTNASRNTKRVVLAIFGVALLAAAIRIWQARTGSVAEVQAATEVGAGLSMLAVAFAVARLWAAARRPGRIFLGVTLLAWVAAVLVPLWRFGHRPAPVYQGILGGAEREVEVGPAPETAVYTLSIGRPTESVDGDYVLEVRAGDDERKLRSRFGRERDEYSLPLEGGQKATLFLEIGAAAAVEVALPTWPWRWVRIAALLVIVLACVGEMSVSRSQPRVRGLWTAVIAVTALYLVFLNPGGDPSGRVAAGAAMGSLAAGGALGALWGSQVRRMRARKRSR